MTKAEQFRYIFTVQVSFPTLQYKVLIEPELLDFPSADEVADATRTNFIIEQQLRIAPTQYMWFHRRFKSRPKVMTVFTNLYGRRKDS